ncbi:hypothetical protein OsI_35507 [Oryza sativa Indica Group]|uniref:Uncharacterized protein n=1 Tax=Oryza sativa subsp. indica TaxID=39946 RepID=B8BJN7_ORYSI|nr:hypothetical protein OsI_35507 [Oryza sativa Indica Group]
MRLLLQRCSCTAAAATVLQQLANSGCRGCRQPTARPLPANRQTNGWAVQHSQNSCVIELPNRPNEEEEEREHVFAPDMRHQLRSAEEKGGEEVGSREEREGRRFGQLS